MDVTPSPITSDVIFFMLLNTPELRAFSVSGTTSSPVIPLQF